MVMHARKPPRINDGYFEKHQSHPYQNSKYGSSKSYSSERSYDRMRDSPNGNSYRSDSPDSQSPRDRSYQSKSYLQKIRDKERDYKSRDKYSDCARSPKDKRSRDSRDSEYRSNHDRSNLEKRDERERVARVGDWSEHISSSGKKYYYNCKTEVSQWEKPRDWLERERGRSLRDSDRNYSSSSSRGHDKHSSSSSSRSMVGGSSRDQGNKSARDRDHYWNSSSQSASNREEEPHDKRKHLDESQDMDISPGDSTPTSEYSRTPTSAVSEHHPSTSRVNMVNPPPITPQRFPQVTSPSSLPPTTSSSSMSFASLPRLLSQITGTKDQSELSPQKALQTIQTLLSRQASLEPGGSTSYETPHQPLKVDTILNNPPQQAQQQQQGPPTPTHSESQDYVDARKVSSPPSSLSSLQSLAGGSMHALRPQGPHLTPSLANFYRDDLVNHVRGLPADLLEKQAQKLSDEAYILGSLQCTKVSAELKTARSIVRLTEIQATLQEQRILFLRQQIKQLEEMKSQNSFMSDS